MLSNALEPEGIHPRVARLRLFVHFTNCANGADSSTCATACQDAFFRRETVDWPESVHDSGGLCYSPRHTLRRRVQNRRPSGDFEKLTPSAVLPAFTDPCRCWLGVKPSAVGDSMRILLYNPDNGVT